MSGNSQSPINHQARSFTSLLRNWLAPGTEQKPRRRRTEETVSHEGKVISIYIGSQSEATMVEVASVRAVAGKGLEGDRYANGVGTFSGKAGTGREVTLIEAEAIESLAREYDVEMDPVESRRNLVTLGLPLNHLVGREFRVGDVTLRGLRLCEPCSHLETLTRPGVRRGLVHRGGLRADIINGGVIRAGDTATTAFSSDR